MTSFPDAGAAWRMRVLRDHLPKDLFATPSRESLQRRLTRALLVADRLAVRLEHLMNTTKSRYAVIFSFIFQKYTVLDRTTGEYLKNQKGNIRLFGARNSARKAITRERTGDFHR